MTMIRDIIIKRMKELDMNTNQLYEKLKDKKSKKYKVPRQTIYDFLSGKTDARSEVVSELIKALDLELVPKKKSKKQRGK